MRLAAAAAVLVLGCAKGAPTNPVAEPVAVAAQLSRLLPAKVGAFQATGEPVDNAQASYVASERNYGAGKGKTITVSLRTGDVKGDRLVLASDAEHAFGSDTPTYWRTTSVRGFRTRVAEQRPTVRSSECYVAVGAAHVAFVRVAPARAGECEEVAGLLDLETLARAPTVRAGARR